MQNLQPLPAAWVEKIFKKFVLAYGRDFMSRYEGVRMSDVVDDWGRELAGFQDNIDALRHGMENLPAAKPPTAMEFRDMCRRAPPPAFKALAAPQATQEQRENAIKVCRELRIRLGGSSGDPKEWAHRLASREESGEKLSSVQKRFWREALIGAEA